MKYTAAYLKFFGWVFVLFTSCGLWGQNGLGPPSTLKTFQVFIDRDANPATGFDALMNDGVSIAAGVELLMTVTVNAGAMPQVVLVEAQEWDGNAAFLPAYFADASGWPVGTNNGTNGSDVVEAFMPLNRLGITQNINFFIQSGEPNAAFDIMGPAAFSFGVPIPTLTQWMLLIYVGLFVIAALWFLRRQRKSKTKGLLILFAGLFFVGLGTTIILDGQIGDWTGPPLATDPVNDAAEDAIDLLAFFAGYDNLNLFARFDVEELENQAPIPDDQAVSLFEDTPTVISLTASDPNANPLLFTLDTGPTNGALGGLTPTGPTSADVTYTPNPDFNGGDGFTFMVDDQNGGTAIGTITITVDPINDVPSFTAGAPVSVLKDTGPQTIANWATNISSGPANESGQILSFQVTVASNPQVFSVAPAIDATTGDLTFTPDADNNGVATLDIVLMDDGGTANGGVDTSPIQAVTLTVGAVNDPPSFTAGADQTHNEDDGAISVNGWATAISPGPPDEAGQVLNFNANITSDPGSIFAVAPAINATNGDLTYTLAGDAFGVASVDVTLMDDGGTANGGSDTSPVQVLTITVNAVNDAPSFTNAGNVNVFKGGSPETIMNWAGALSTGPANESGQSFVGFTIMVTSDVNSVLNGIPTVDTVSGNLVFDTTADNNGTATISVTLQDDGGTANGGVDTSVATVIDILVGAVNDAPSFIAGADQTHNEDDGAISVNGWATAISPGPPDEAGQVLNFNANITSDPGSIFAVAPAINATSGNLTYTLAANAFGVASVDVTLIDNGGTANGGSDTSPVQVLTITVNAVNDAPSFTNTGNVNVFKGGSTETIMNWAGALSTGPANESGQSFVGFTVMVTSDVNSVLNGIPTVDTVSGNLVFDTTADNNGTATISVTLQDDGGTANGGVDTSVATVIDILVGAVNDAPSFIAGANQTHNEDDGVITVNGWATAISPGPPDEAGQVLNFNANITSDPGSIFTVAPAINATSGDLTYTLAGDAFGVASVDVTLMDNGGTANGGSDTSPVQVLTITVNAVNDAPSFTNAGNVNVFKGGSTETIMNWASALSTGPANESGQSFVGFTVMVTSDVNSVLNGIPTVDTVTGNLVFGTTADNNGTATISVTLQDDGGTANGGVDTSVATVIDINVQAVNDAPSFTIGPNITVDENSGPQSINPWATGISAGPPDEAGQVLTFNVTGNTIPGLFSTAPAIAADGTLTFETAFGANTGSPATPVVITIALMDNGGTANGGVDTSPPQMFSITVNPVNSPPVATNNSYDAAVNTRIEVGTTTAALGHKIAGSVLTDGVADSDPDGPGPLIVTGTSNVTAGAIVSMNADGSFTYTPPAGMTGSDTFDYTITDQDLITPLTDTGTVTINLFDPVWYVENDHAGSNEGTSDNPFLTLAQAETAASTTEKIYLFIGDGTVMGHNAGITLQNGQSLLGERVDLVLNINGSMSTIVTGTGVNTMAPRIGNVGGDVIILADDNTVRGLIILPTASAGIIDPEPRGMKQGRASQWQVSTNKGKRAGGTTVVSEVVINPSGTSDGLELFNQTGNFTFNNSEITGLAGNSGTGIRLESCSASFTLDNLTIGSLAIGIRLSFNTTPGGINFTNTQIANCSSSAIDTAFQDDLDLATTCTINQTTGGRGVTVFGGNGTLSFNGPITATGVGAGLNAIQLNGNNQNPTINFAALTIDASAAGHAIRIDNMGATSDLNFTGLVDINGAGMHGLFLNNVNGPVDFSNASSDIANAAASGINMSAGAPSLTYPGTLINNNVSVSMTNLTGGTNAFSGLMSQGAQLSGFTATNCAGTHFVSQANFGTLANRLTGPGINLTTSTGNFSFDDFSVFTQGDGFVISGGSPTVTVLPAGTTSSINTNGGFGINANAGTLNGTFTNTLVNTGLAANTGISLLNGGGTVTFGDIDLDIGQGQGIFINGTYTANFTAASSITVNTASALGVAIQNSTISGTIDSVVVVGGMNGGINLTTNTGSLSFGLVTLATTNSIGFNATNSGTIEVTDNTSSITTTGATGLQLNTIAIGGSNMSFATINASNTGATNEGIDIDGVTGGTLSVTNTVTNTTVSGGNGIDINGSSASFSFSAANIDTSNDTGINLINNISGNFTFNNCDIDTTTGIGFNASGGGSISGSGTNTVATTTGRGIQIDGSNIGAANFSFQSVNTNGAPNGIRLNNTGSNGGLIVTGTGGNDSGGNIQNSTADGISLNNTVGVSFTNMQVNNSTTSHINATTVNGLTLAGLDFASSGFHGLNGSGITALNMTNCTFDLSGNSANEHGIRIINLLGTSNITSSDFTRSQTIHVLVQNTSSSVAAPAAPTDILTFDDCSFSIPGALFGDNISVESGASGNFRVILDDAIGQNTFVGSQDGIQAVTSTGGTLDFIVDNIDVQTITGTGINVGGFNASTLTFDIRNSSTLNTGSIGINVTSIGGANLSGIVDNNVINGSSTGQGIQVITEGNGDITAIVSNNNIDNINQEHGIRVQARAGSGTINITINNNDVNNPGGFPLEGIYAESGSSAGGDTNTICLNMFSNISSVSFNEGFRVRHRPGTTFNLQDFVGVGSNPADVTTWINTTKSNTGTTQITGTGFTAAPANCPTPP